MPEGSSFGGWGVGGGRKGFTDKGTCELRLMEVTGQVIRKHSRQGEGKYKGPEVGTRGHV